MALGGSAAAVPTGCVVRDWQYMPEYNFTFDASARVSQYPECIPTCGAPQNSVEQLPAGPCSNEAPCSAMILILSAPDAGGGFWSYFVCSCAGYWDCKRASGI